MEHLQSLVDESASKRKGKRKHKRNNKVANVKGKKIAATLEHNHAPCRLKHVRQSQSVKTDSTHGNSKNPPDNKNGHMTEQLETNEC